MPFLGGTTTYDTTGIICPYCQSMHDWKTCPRIKRIEYWESGAVRAVEFHDYISAGSAIGFQLPASAAD